MFLPVCGIHHREHAIILVICGGDHREHVMALAILGADHREVFCEKGEHLLSNGANHKENHFLLFLR